MAVVDSDIWLTVSIRRKEVGSGVGDTFTNFIKGGKEPMKDLVKQIYQDFNGLKIATSHKMAEGNFNLYFSNIKVK